MELVDGLGIAANITFSCHAEDIGNGLLRERRPPQNWLSAVIGSALRIGKTLIHSSGYSAIFEFL
tara:strand:- start:273 stop:467 length:195 start_codon:yes stop_codon:yes gene_type:complete